MSHATPTYNVKWNRAAGELLGVFAFFLPGVFFSFSLAAASRNTPLGIPAWIGLGLYVVGSWLNTWSEQQRYWWKQHGENKGHLYTGGLFSLSRHINYFGDMLLSSGWAMGSDRWWNVWAPLFMTTGFVFGHIPELEKYLAHKYSEEWPEYARKVKSLVPFIF